MSKRTRTLLISAVALLALAAVLVVLLFLPDGEGANGGTTTTTVPDPTVVLVEKGETVTVSQVNVSLKDERFTILPDKNKDLTVKGYEDLPRSDASYELLSEVLLAFSAYRLISETPKHPEDFGFNAEEGGNAALEVTYSDNTTFAFEIGDLAPSGEGYYLRKADSTAIYLVDTTFVDTVTAGSLTYLSTMPFTAPVAEKAQDEVVVRDVTLSGSVRPTPLTFQISTEVFENGQQAQMISGFYLTKPYLRNVKSDTKLLSSSEYYGFAADKVAKVRPTAADLKAYGLDSPYSECLSHITVKRITETLDEETGDKKSTLSFYNTFEYRVKLGKETEDGLRYAVVYMDDDMVPLLYVVDPLTVTWAETQYDDLADLLLFFTYIDQVEKMTILMDGTGTTFNLTHHADEEDRDAQLTVIANGKQYKTSSFRTLYTEGRQITRKAALTTKPTGETLLRIDIVTNTSIAHTGWIKLYQQSAGKYAVLHDTGESYLVDAKDVESFMTSYRRFLSGEAI